jgi:hypothetical protein
MKNQSAPLPQSRTFNGGEGAKTIRQPYYLLNINTEAFFLFQRGEVGAG